MQCNHGSESISKTPRREHSWEINWTDANLKIWMKAFPTKAQEKTSSKQCVACGYCHEIHGERWWSTMQSCFLKNYSVCLSVSHKDCLLQVFPRGGQWPHKCLPFPCSCSPFQHMQSLACNLTPILFHSLEISLLVSLRHLSNKYSLTFHTAILFHSNENVKNIWVPHLIPSVTTQSSAAFGVLKFSYKSLLPSPSNPDTPHLFYFRCILID